MATYGANFGADYYSKPAEIKGHAIGPEMDGKPYTIEQSTSRADSLET